MGERFRRRAVYLTTIAAMVAMTGGFVLATTISTITAPPPQGGGFASTGSPPANVATTNILMTQAAATSAATVSSIGAPTLLTAAGSSATDTFFVNGVATVGDFLQTMTITFTAGGPNVAPNTEYEISIFIAGSTSAPQIVFVETGASFASPAVNTVNFVYDMGSGSGTITITSVSDLITQCSAVGTCS